MPNCKYGEYIIRAESGRVVCKPYKEMPMSWIKIKDEEEGGHFFSRENMRFFNSKIESRNAKIKGRKAYFITSEQFVSSEGSLPREYKVREINLDNWDIHTIREEGYQPTRSKSLAIEKLHQITKG